MLTNKLSDITTDYNYSNNYNFYWHKQRFYFGCDLKNLNKIYYVNVGLGWNVLIHNVEKKTHTIS